MINEKTSSRLAHIIKSALMGAAVPIFILYIMLAKPDYAIMNGLAHVVLPIAHVAGDIVTWPIRAIGQGVSWVKDMSNLHSENKRLREQLDILLATKTKCDVAMLENQKLEQEIAVKTLSPYKTVIADVRFDDAVFHHNTFLINRGNKDGLNKGMVVVSFHNQLVGIITDCGSQFCRVRALTDTDSNIAIRIGGADVSGFLHGDGKSGASIGFFSDTQFATRAGLKIITSSISGVLPAGIYVGDMIDESRVNVLKPNQLSRVMVLQYNNQGSY